MEIAITMLALAGIVAIIGGVVFGLISFSCFLENLSQDVAYNKEWRKWANDQHKAACERLDALEKRLAAKKAGR